MMTKARIINVLTLASTIAAAVFGALYEKMPNVAWIAIGTALITNLSKALLPAEITPSK